MLEFFSIMIFFALVPELLLLPKNFLVLTNLFRILHSIEDCQLSQQIHVVAL